MAAQESWKVKYCTDSIHMLPTRSLQRCILAKIYSNILQLYESRVLSYLQRYLCLIHRTYYSELFVFPVDSLLILWSKSDQGFFSIHLFQMLEFYLVLVVAAYCVHVYGILDFAVKFLSLRLRLWHYRGVALSFSPSRDGGGDVILYLDSQF